MDYTKEQNAILQPDSWESVVAQQAALSPQQLASTQPATALQATARSFLAECYKNPTRFQIDELARCIETYNQRKAKWKKRKQELQEEQEEEQEARQDSLFAAQSNISLGTLLKFQSQITHYTKLLASAQKHAADTQFLFTEKLPVNLPPDKARTAFISLLRKHAVIYTPFSIVATIQKHLQYAQLSFHLYIAKHAEENFSTPDYELAVEVELQDIECFSQLALLSANQAQDSLAALGELPSSAELTQMRDEINISPEEQNQLDAWIALQEEFPVPESFPDDALLEDWQPEDVPLLDQQPSFLESKWKPLPQQEPATPPMPADAPPLPKKLPKMYNTSPLQSVCKFLYGLTKDVAFADIPHTSHEIKCLLDKFHSNPFLELQHSLEQDLRIQYGMANKRLGDFYQAQLEQEANQQTKVFLDIISSCREGLPEEDPVKDYREAPQTAATYYTQEDTSNK